MPRSTPGICTAIPLGGEEERVKKLNMQEARTNNEPINRSRALKGSMREGKTKEKQTQCGSDVSIARCLSAPFLTKVLFA